MTAKFYLVTAREAMDYPSHNEEDKIDLTAANHLENGSVIDFSIQEGPPTIQEVTEAERRFLWKVDLIILPLVALMYFLASMVSQGKDESGKDPQRAAH
jgi:hypothetical protein